MTRRYPPPDYPLHCFVLVRSARQFLFHARFEPNQPPLPTETYRALIRKVVSRSPRRPSPAEEKILIPGYDSLRAFSQTQEQLLKANCGGAWQSYILRSHWRMVFPVSRRHQEKTARQLTEKIAQAVAPIIHVVRFPQLTINHGLLLYDQSETDKEIRFLTYDPNVPEQPSCLVYDRAQRTFCFPRNRYWAGGRVDVIEIYRSWFY